MAPPDATALLARLVARPTIAGGDNLELIADIAAVLDEAGADVRVHDGTRPGTNVLHAVLGPADAPGGVLLAAHGDVVDVAGQSWTADPFVLRADGGRLHGRGAADMKGFIAATLAAVSRADPSSLNAPLHVAISHDEELACAGIAPLLDALEIAAPLAGVVVGEPTELRVVDRHKGKAALDITVRGRAAHSATPSAGVNAVRAAAHLIVALEELGAAAGVRGERPVVLDAARHDRHRPDPRRRRAQHRAGPLHAAGRDARAPWAAARRDRRADRRRWPPAPRCAAPAATRRSRRPRTRSARASQRSPATVTGGAVDFGTEAGLYQERLGVPVVVCGPGSMTQGHTPDEFITADQLAAGEAFIDRLLRQLAAA